MEMKPLVEYLLTLDKESKFEEKTQQEIWAFYKNSWESVIRKKLTVKPFFDRIPNKPLDLNSKVWVYAYFVKPGKHQYFLLQKDNNGNIKKLFLTTFVKARKENI